MDFDNCFIIDFEFTHLPMYNTPRAEMAETKIGVVKNGQLVYKQNWIHKTTIPIAKGSFFVNRITKEEQTEPHFSKDWLLDTLDRLSKTYGVKKNLWGFSTSADMDILNKTYGLILPISCLQQYMRTTVEYEHLMATEGASMGFCHYLITDKIIDIAHKGTAEVDAIYDILTGIKRLESKPVLTYVPWGKFRGQPLKKAVEARKNWAVGYAANNQDLLAKSLLVHLAN
jgi:hypothetical protein